MGPDWHGTTDACAHRGAFEAIEAMVQRVSEVHFSHRSKRSWKLSYPSRSVRKHLSRIAQHVPTLAEWGGTALFEHALRAEVAGEGGRCGLETGEREIVLDVLVSNTRAVALYRRLGFIAQPRRRPRARNLPAQLESVRMKFGMRGGR